MIKNKKAFTIAEMMVVLLIVSLVTAAFIPVITTRSKIKSSESIWQWVNGTGTDIYVPQLSGTNYGTVIGATNMGGSSAKLLLNTADTSIPHIRFSQAGSSIAELGFSGTNTVLGNASRTAGSNNTVFGRNSLNNNTTGVENVVIGSSALTGSAASPVVSHNTAVGYGALWSTQSNDNTAVGWGALSRNTTGSGNVAVGYNASTNNTTATNTVSIGISSEAINGSSIAIGNAAKSRSDAAIAIGESADVTDNDWGFFGIAVGPFTKVVNSGVAVGAYAMAGASDVAIGYNALEHDSISYNNGDDGDNVAIGRDALSSSLLTTYSSKKNIAIGALSMGGLDTPGSGNIAIGDHALYAIYADVYSRPRTKGSNNVGVGTSALYNNYSTTGNNVAVGNQACIGPGGGSYNVCIGSGSNTNDDNGDESNVIAIGNAAKARGDYNIALGYRACFNVLGTNKTCIGINSGPTNGGTYSADTDTVERIFLGQAQNATSGAPVEIHPKGHTGSGGYTMIVNGSLRVDGFTNTSDKRLKNINGYFASGLDFIKKLKPYNYTFKNDKNKEPRVGVVAQDVQKVFPDAVSKGPGGYLAVRQEDMFYAMVNAIKELDMMIQSLKSDFKALVARVQQIDDKIAALVRVNQVNSQKIKALEAKNMQLEKQNKAFEARLKKLEKLSQGK